MAASSSSISCFNCKKSSSDQLSDGWKISTGGYAKLCGTCYSVFKDGKFCEEFHLNEYGWRNCEDCTRPFHCGCIVSLRDYSLDDFRGIICLKCKRAGYDSEPSDLGILRSPEPNLVLLFEKVLTVNDTKRKNGYIIIPKKHAKVCFSEAFGNDKRFPTSILDTDGKYWECYFWCWVYGNKKKFVLKGLSRFMVAKNMEAGDTAAFYRRVSDGKILLEIRKPYAEITTDNQASN